MTFVNLKATDHNDYHTQLGLLATQPNSKELFAEAMILGEMAYEAQGPRAFEAPREAAALHEAGHAVIYAASGIAVESVAVWPIPTNRACWIGLTESAVGKWFISKDTSPEADAAQIRYQMAGWVAEITFMGKDFRAASSIDEVVMAQNIARYVAMKTGSHPATVFIENCAIVNDVLQRNEAAVRAIAKKLSTGCRKKLLGVSLAKILADVTTDARLTNAASVKTGDDDGIKGNAPGDKPEGVHEKKIHHHHEVKF